MGCLLCCPQKLKRCFLIEDIEQNSVENNDQSNIIGNDEIVLNPETLSYYIEEEKSRRSIKAPSTSQIRNQINHQQNILINQHQDNEPTQQKVAQNQYDDRTDVSVVVSKTPRTFKEIKQKRNEKLNTKLVSIIDLTLFDFETETTSNSPVSYIPLRRHDAEFLLIYSKISRKDNFIVHKIERIENKYLLNSYLLKAEQKKQQFPQLKEELLFHGTSKEVVDYICTMGFDWRCVEEHKFGKGISFSTNSSYASVYSDECHNKVMLVCKVLVGKCCPGNNRMIIPSDQFDTSLKATPNGGMERIVTVKYEDGEYYPAYKIYYHLVQPTQRRVRYNRHR